jgi:hypothetical protein
MRYVLILILGASSFAQSSVPNAPSFKAPLKDPFFWSGTLFHASSVLADVHHSQDCQRDKTCFEVNPGADKYRNRIPEIALFAAADYGCSMMLQSHRRWRIVCLAAPVAVGILHWKDATRIYK